MDSTNSARPFDETDFTEEKKAKLMKDDAKHQTIIVSAETLVLCV